MSLSLSISLAYLVSLARVAAQAHTEMHVYAHTKSSAPLFSSLPTYNSNPALSLPLPSREHPFFVSLVSYLAFFLCILISSPSLASLDQVSRKKSRGEREGKIKKKGESAGVKLPPSSEKRPPASPPLSSPLPSQSVFTPIPRQHHRRARDLRVEHPSVFNGGSSYARPLLSPPFIFVSLLPPFPFLSLSPPLFPHLTLRTGFRSLSLNRIPSSVPPPLSGSPLLLSRSEHVRGRG